MPLIEGPRPADPTITVQRINAQRGCPFPIPRDDRMTGTPVVDLTANARKKEYYHLLDGVLPRVIANVRQFREEFPEGIVKYAPDGTIVSGLADLETSVKPFLETGQFFPAAYLVHDAVYRTIDIATEKWLAETDTTSPEYRRINELVDDPRQETYGNVAIQKRVASAANQTVLISASFQRIIDQQFPKSEGRPTTSEDMDSIHAASMRMAMPLTQLHILETRFMRKILGGEKFFGSDVEVYTNGEYFTLDEGMLKPNGTLMVDALAGYPGNFPDGRIGCPGAKYVPEIWAWLGDLSRKYSYPIIDNKQPSPAASSSAK